MVCVWGVLRGKGEGEGGEERNEEGRGDGEEITKWEVSCVRVAFCIGVRSGKLRSSKLNAHKHRYTYTADGHMYTKTIVSANLVPPPPSNDDARMNLSSLAPPPPRL